MIDAGTMIEEAETGHILVILLVDVLEMQMNYSMVVTALHPTTAMTTEGLATIDPVLVLLVTMVNVSVPNLRMR